MMKSFKAGLLAVLLAATSMVVAGPTEAHSFAPDNGSSPSAKRISRPVLPATPADISLVRYSAGTTGVIVTDEGDLASDSKSVEGDTFVPGVSISDGTGQLEVGLNTIALEGVEVFTSGESAITVADDHKSGGVFFPTTSVVRGVPGVSYAASLAGASFDVLVPENSVIDLRAMAHAAGSDLAADGNVAQMTMKVIKLNGPNPSEDVSSLTVTWPENGVLNHDLETEVCGGSTYRIVFSALSDATAFDDDPNRVFYLTAAGEWDVEVADYDFPHCDVVGPLIFSVASPFISSGLTRP